MRTALVTGGSRGIGRAICLQLAKMGYHVLVNYKSRTEEARNSLDTIIAAGATGELLAFDVADRQQVKNILGGWLEANPDKPVEVLVNNAGIREDALMTWMEDEQWDAVIRTNLDPFVGFLASREAAYITAQVLSVNGGLYS